MKGDPNYSILIASKYRPNLAKVHLGFSTKTAAMSVVHALVTDQEHRESIITLRDNVRNEECEYAT